MPTFNVDIANWDSIYAEEDDMIPWNIGKPQPVLQDLIDQGFVTSPVLDAGCGVGVTTLYLASHGYEAVGVDLSRTAIDSATVSAQSAGLSAQFINGDLTRLSGYDEYFSTVVDSAVFHSMPVALRASYIKALYQSTKPGARFFALVFTPDAFITDYSYGPRTFTAEELRLYVEPFFTVDAIVPAKLHLVIPKKIPEGFAFSHAIVGSSGLIQLPGLLLSAHKSTL